MACEVFFIFPGKIRLPSSAVTGKLVFDLTLKKFVPVLLRFVGVPLSTYFLSTTIVGSGSSNTLVVVIPALLNLSWELDSLIINMGAPDLLGLPIYLSWLSRDRDLDRE